MKNSVMMTSIKTIVGRHGRQHPKWSNNVLFSYEIVWMHGKPCNFLTKLLYGIFSPFTIWYFTEKSHAKLQRLIFCPTCALRITNIFIQLLVTKIHAINILGSKFKLSLGPWEFRGNKICVSSPDSWGGGADSLIPSWCLVPRSLQSCLMIAAIWIPTADMLLPWDIWELLQIVKELIIEIL